MDIEDFDWTEDDYRIIRFKNEVAIPGFREYCKEEGYNLYFPDEHPFEELDFELYCSQRETRYEAIGRYELSKPEFTYFDGDVFQYYVATDWVTIKDQIPIAKFLSDVSEANKKNRKKEIFLLKFIGFLMLWLWVVMTLQPFFSNASGTVVLVLYFFLCIRLRSME
jgi:hypothetical protein